MALRIEILLAVLDMTMDCCMDWFRPQVSQYIDCTWIGGELLSQQHQVAEFAKSLCRAVDGRTQNMAFQISVHDAQAHSW